MTDPRVILLSSALIFGAGFAAAEIYEHVAPWGLQAQRDRIRDSIPDKERAAHAAGVKAQADADAPAFEDWRKKLAACEASRKSDLASSASTIAQANTNATTEAARAFRLGRATCGATDAPSPLPEPSPVSGGLRADDLLESYRSGAFTPASGG